MKFLNEIINLGIDINLTSKEKKKLRILNIGCFLLVISSLFYIIYGLLNAELDSMKFTALSFQLFSFGVVLLFQYHKVFLYARYLFIGLIYAVIFYQCNFAYQGFYGEYNYIIAPLLSLFFFEKKYIHYFFLFLSLTFFTFQICTSITIRSSILATVIPFFYTWV